MKVSFTGANSRRKEHLLRGIDLKSARGMELGPFYSPTVLKSEGDITYVDRLSAAQLIERHQKVDPTFTLPVPEVDVVTGDRPLASALAGRRFDYIIASHVIEHVPNFIGWLEQFRAMLNPGGTLRLVIPDKRYTFDLLRRLTEPAEVIDAHLRNADRPPPYCVFESQDKVRKVDMMRAWDGSLPAELERHFSPIEAAGMARLAAEGEYIDVHCWVFTPLSFCNLMADLCGIGLVNLACAWFCHTEQYSFEFIAHLMPSADRAKSVESWRHITS